MAEKSKDIVIFTDEPGWHGRVLKEALRSHGLSGQYASLIDCSFEINDGTIDLIIPGFAQRRPLAAFVRGIPGGSLEQVIQRLNVLHHLNARGITVFNEASAIERTVDKSMTSLLLTQAGIPTVKTWVTESKVRAAEILQREKLHSNELVIKPLFGSQGIGVQKFESTHQLEDETFKGVFYLQRYINTPGKTTMDMRVFVVHQRVIAAMIRKSEHWITNRAQGASCESFHPDSIIEKLALDAVKSCQIDYAGVDIMLDESGMAKVIEVNSIPAWWGLQKVTQIDIASRIIDAFCARIADNSPEKLTSL